MLAWTTTAVGWQWSSACHDRPLLLNALLDVAHNHLHFSKCIGGVVAHGVQRLPKLGDGGH
eukprot:11290497-Karenia_brevis.AAC.1